MSATATPPVPTGTTTPPPASAGPKPWRVTRDEYYRLGELGFFDGKRVELIYGGIVEMSPIGWPHSLGVGLVTDVLAAIFSNGFYLNVQQPLFIRNITWLGTATGRDRDSRFAPHGNRPPNASRTCR